MIAFLLIAIVVIVSPGPDFALTVRNTVTRGRRELKLIAYLSHRAPGDDRRKG